MGCMVIRQPSLTCRTSPPLRAISGYAPVSPMTSTTKQMRPNGKGETCGHCTHARTHLDLDTLTFSLHYIAVFSAGPTTTRTGPAIQVGHFPIHCPVGARGHSENCVPILCTIVRDIYKYALHCNSMAYWRRQYRETNCYRFPVNFDGLEPPARKILLG